MKSRKPHMDVSGPAQSLTDCPFAVLASQRMAAPEVVPTPAPIVAAEKAEVVQRELAFRVERTRKGGYPVFLENRAQRQVTVIRNVTGDAEGLLRRLKRYLGAGGVVRDGAVELQGDHRDKVIEWLKGCGGLS